MQKLETIEEEAEEVFTEAPQNKVSKKKQPYNYKCDDARDICQNFTYGPALAYYGVSWLVNMFISYIVVVDLLNLLFQLKYNGR